MIRRLAEVAAAVATLAALGKLAHLMAAGLDALALTVAP